MNIQITDTLQFFTLLTLELTLLFFLVSTLVGVIRAYALSRGSSDKSSNNKIGILDGNWGRGNIVGAAFGAITPFCSCSTVPVMRGLLQSNVRFGVVITFLLASPLLNPIVIAMMGMMVGWQGTLLYATLIFILVVLLGITWEKLGLEKHLYPQTEAGITSSGERSGSFFTILKSSAKISFTELKSILPYLLVGVAIGSLIYGFVPEQWIADVAGADNLFAIPTAAVIGVPLYVRIETMIPIGIALLGKGMGIGAIIALIIGGSGASIPEISMLAKIFKPKLLVIFVSTILLLAITTGMIFQLLM